MRTATTSNVTTDSVNRKKTFADTNHFIFFNIIKAIFLVVPIKQILKNKFNSHVLNNSAAKDDKMY